MVALIEISQNGNILQSVKLSQTFTSFGRSSHCTIGLVGRAVSRRHCYILQLMSPGDRSYWIFDGGIDSTGKQIRSSGGIMFNNERIDHRKLVHGDQITLPSDYMLTFYYLSGLGTTGNGKDTLA